jgi:hypothetical protein
MIRRHPLSLTHDSFLDVVSNVVGVLVLVAIAVILNAKDIKIDLGAPVVRPPPKATTRVIFECSRERIFRLDDQALHTISREFASRYVTEQARTITPIERQRLFERSDVGNDAYRVRIPDVRSSSLQLELRENAAGENSLQILEPNSAYQAELARLSPATHWVFFIVRNDSFEMFRGARKIALERGLSVGWDPKERDAPLIFGNDARDGVAAQW